jgi:SAM-dependent methyltransferase
MNDQWYQESFGDDYLLVYQHRNRAMADQEVDQLLTWLDLSGEDRILDLCCGMGRHSITLAKRGLHVLGLDLSEALLNKANALAYEEGLWIPFVRGDMRKLPFVDNSFDIVLNLFTSFGYFSEDDENRRVLEEISRVLRTSGRFFIDFLNRKRVIESLVPESQRFDQDVAICEKRWIDGDFVCKKILVRDERGERVYHERVKMYTFEQMCDLLTQSGLVPVEAYGNFHGDPYNEDSERMLILGKVGV